MKNMKQPQLLVKSPLNYTGGKYKLLSQILPLFPSKLNTFVDLFGGGFNVGINVDAKKIIYNDNIYELCELLKYFYTNDEHNIFSDINNTILKYNLSKSNKSGFLSLRSDYNNSKNVVQFFCLISHAFNYQIRFNSKGQYNVPFGGKRSSYNDTMSNNMISFINKLHDKKIEFNCCDFRKFNFNKIKKNDFVYCDPPYLITDGSYNDGKRRNSYWDESCEVALLNLLDSLNDRKISFALSNVFEHGEKQNIVLINWAKKYNVYKINSSYKNSNYRKKTTHSVEVLITNYVLN